MTIEISREFLSWNYKLGIGSCFLINDLKCKKEMKIKINIPSCD